MNEVSDALHPAADLFGNPCPKAPKVLSFRQKKGGQDSGKGCKTGANQSGDFGAHGCIVTI